MSARRVHVIYEWGHDLRPHGSAYIRLLRPLSHPVVQDCLEVSFGRFYDGQVVDAVIVDRLWRPRDVTLAGARALASAVRRAGARLIYALDDDLLDSERIDSSAQRAVAEYWLRQADGVVVTTRALRARLTDLNPRTVVVPNALDERLLPGAVRSDAGGGRIVIGYMGTLTHDEDLLLIAPALRTVCARHAGEIEIQLVGVTARQETLEALEGLPVRVVSPLPGEGEYPLFMIWLTQRLHWDIALAPLADTPFNACKSDLKHLDYAAMSAAGIYSAVPAYTQSVRHAETGWLAHNDSESWVDALETLIARPALLRTMARAAVGYLYGERVLARQGRAWVDALEALLE
jgi:processive 1,2-diacylglycerol beta-glucosyltransferase